jgi:cytochrome c-type biogenesis protein CcmH/NrfF
MGLAWKRLEPRLRPKVNKSRHQRLMREGGKSYVHRWEVVVTQYSNFVKTLPPLRPTGLHLVVRAPPTPTEFLCENQALADAVAFGGQEFRAQVSEAIRGLATDVPME